MSEKSEQGPRDITVEPLAGPPRFLAIAAYAVGDETHEIVSRKRLDTRQVVPFFVHDGVLHVGALERARASRLVRGADPMGLEPIGFDFSGVDETGDILHYGRAMFSARSGVRIDDTRAAIPLPSFARSIGYATELALPLLVPIESPSKDAITNGVDVSWDGAHHRIRFAPLEAMRARVEGASARAFCAAEDLALMLDALSPPRPQAFATGSDAAARRLLSREATRIRDHRALADRVRARVHGDSFARRLGELQGDALRFLRASRVRSGDRAFEVVTPGAGVSLAVLPWIVADGEPWFLLWSELRVSTLERGYRQPIFDVPIHPHHVNATARFVSSAIVDEENVGDALAKALGTRVRVHDLRSFGVGEPAVSFSSEVRHRVGCALDPDSIGALPDDAILVSGRELAAAVRDGVVRDPVIVSGLLALGIDPFERARSGDPQRRRAFLDRMTEGSIVQRRLESYSSIEAEQLGSSTYARVMLLLQHEYGVRIAYPKTESDRSFFKAAFRVFMAAPRVVEGEGEHETTDTDRAMQGLHWSHDAFHFGLGNFTLPPWEGFEEWFLSGAKLPEPLPPEGPVFDGYVRALKTAEDEATFFSFWVLYEEQPSLTRFVHAMGQLPYWEACRALGLNTREEARSVFDDVTIREVLPARVREHEVYKGREDVRKLFDYMLGFRAYHLKDITAAWKFASRDPFRGTFVRFGIYESDVERYVANVRGFRDKLFAQPPGLSPLHAMAADVRVGIALRVFDVTKAMRLLRTAAGEKLPESERRAARAKVLAEAETHLAKLEALQTRLRAERAKIGDAELSSANEETWGELVAMDGEVERVRAQIWDWAAGFGWMDAKVIEEERARELPR